MITAVAVIVAAVILAVTSADRTNLADSQTSSNTLVPSTTPHTTNTTAHPTSSAPPSSSSTVPRPTTTARPRTTTPASAEKAKNLLVTAGVESSLVRSWLATNPGGVDLSRERRRRDPTRGGLLRRAAGVGHLLGVGRVQAFAPRCWRSLRRRRDRTKLAEFQNSIYAFSWQSGPVWTLLGEVSTGSCPGVVPAPVLKVWGMCGLSSRRRRPAGHSSPSGSRGNWTHGRLPDVLPGCPVPPGRTQWRRHRRRW